MYLGEEEDAVTAQSIFHEPANRKGYCQTLRPLERVLRQASLVSQKPRALHHWLVEGWCLGSPVRTSRHRGVLGDLERLDLGEGVFC